MDELHQPLKRRSRMVRLWSHRPSALVATGSLAICVFALFAAWAIATPNPMAGEPVVMAAIPAPVPIETASISKITPTDKDSPDADAETIPDTGTDPVNTDDPTLEATAGQQVIDTDSAIIVSSQRSLPPAPIGDVSEEGPYGPLPRIGYNNRKPSSVYARTVSAGILGTDVPKIAIVLGGMGLNHELTTKAAKALPGDITFAFAPYGENLQPLVNSVRQRGHEILLQVPMEPVGYPQINPGPKTLVIDAGKPANLDSLKWHMGRFAGYTGVMNYMGGKFLSSGPSTQPILTELRQRGLLFLSDGSAQTVSLEASATAARLKTRAATLVFDADPSPLAIEKALASLEATAQANGVAIGVGTGLPATIDLLDTWSKALAERGIALVPISATFRTP